LVDAVVAWGNQHAVLDRVQAHLNAGASHVCIQALTAGPRDVPEGQWRELAPALREVTRG
jgi:2-methylisocitrate lyase-like PEP mutase family enzyme